MIAFRFLRKWWQRISCPHHTAFCKGRACCCRERHWRPVKAWRETDGYIW